MPTGYTKVADIAGSIETDQWLRNQAIAVGVPIAAVGDYGFNALRSWDMNDQTNRGVYATLD
jgi:hypothetical protein